MNIQMTEAENELANKILNWCDSLTGQINDDVLSSFIDFTYNFTDQPCDLDKILKYVAKQNNNFLKLLFYFDCKLYFEFCENDLYTDFKSKLNDMRKNNGYYLVEFFISSSSSIKNCFPEMLVQCCDFLDIKDFIRKLYFKSSKYYFNEFVKIVDKQALKSTKTHIRNLINETGIMELKNKELKSIRKELDDAGPDVDATLKQVEEQNKKYSEKYSNTSTLFVNGVPVGQLTNINYTPTATHWNLGTATSTSIPMTFTAPSATISNQPFTIPGIGIIPAKINETEILNQLNSLKKLSIINTINSGVYISPDETEIINFFYENICNVEYAYLTLYGSIGRIQDDRIKKELYSKFITALLSDSFNFSKDYDVKILHSHFKYGDLSDHMSEDQIKKFKIKFNYPEEKLDVEKIQVAAHQMDPLPSVDAVSNKQIKKETPMAEDTKNWIKRNVESGVKQGMARTAIKNVIKGILLALEKANVSEVDIAIAKQFLESKPGTAIVSAMIGASVHFMPVDKIQENKLIQDVADKCVENATSDGVEEIANVVMNLIYPAIANAISSKGSSSIYSLLDSKVRVDDAEDVEEHVTQSTGVKSSRL